MNVYLISYGEFVHVSHDVEIPSDLDLGLVLVDHVDMVK